MLLQLYELFPEVTIYAENGYWKKTKASKENVYLFIDEFQKNNEGIAYLIEINYQNKVKTFLGTKEFLKEQINKIFDS